MQQSNKSKSLRNSRKSKSNKPNSSKQGVLARRNNGSNQIKSAPVAITNIRTMPTATIQNGRNSTRVVHREYLNDILGSTTFAVDTVININPGFASSFPWLSAIAARYETYRFNRLSFCYETTSATTAVGSVIMAVDYDASDSAPVTKAQMLSYKGAVRASPWEMVSYHCDPADLQKRLNNFTRLGAVPSGTDLKLYDCGVLYVGVAGNAAATAIGELYVDYDVTLSTPQLETDYLSLQIEAGTAITKALPFGSAPLIQGLLPYTIVNTNEAGAYVRVPGDYMFTYVITGTGLIADPSFTRGAGVSGFYKVSSVVLAAATSAIIIYAVRISDVRTGNISIKTNTDFGTVTACQLFITQSDFDDTD